MKRDSAARKIESMGGILELFRMAADFAPVHVIFADPDGYILYVNASAEKLTGYTRKEMIGKRPSLWGGQMPMRFYEEMWNTIKKKKQTFHGEIRNRRKNGKFYTAEVWVKPVVERGKLKGFVGVERDVTNEKNLMAAVLESEGRLREVIENIEEVFFLFDPRTKNTLYVSPAYAKIWGQPADGIAQRSPSWFSGVHPHDRYLIDLCVQEAQKGKHSSIEFRIVRKKGDIRWLRAKVFPVYSQQQLRPYRIAGVLEDVTRERSRS